MSAAAFDAARWSQRRLDEFELALDNALVLNAPQALLAPMRYAALDGGKRMRPLLLMAAAEAVLGRDTEAMSAVLRQALLQAACAVECIHVYSLVHDDLPCMDDDDWRRGRPTTHVRYGQAMAMLAGDALQALAFELLSAAQTGLSAATQLACVKTLAQAAGAAGMCAGQALDLCAQGRSLDQAGLESMHLAKTGALLRAALVLGAQTVRADAALVAALDAFGRDLGLAFQVIDDVLDASADSATLGKTAGKDAAQGKPTFVSLMGAGAARVYAQELVAKATARLDELELMHTAALRALAARVVERAN